MVRVECPGAARRTSILDAVPRTGRAVARHEYAEQWVDVSMGAPSALLRLTQEIRAEKSGEWIWNVGTYLHHPTYQSTVGP